MTIDEVRQLGRAKNAVLAFFEQHLSIPKIYIDAEWDGHPVDVLAINRDGVGDVHAVLLFARKYLQNGGADWRYETEVEYKLLDDFQMIPAQYKYVGVVDTNIDHGINSFTLVDRVTEKSLASDGFGRVGFLMISLPEVEPQVRLMIKPERFRAKIAKLADEYVQQHEADWEIRA